MRRSGRSRRTRGGWGPLRIPATAVISPATVSCGVVSSAVDVTRPVFPRLPAQECVLAPTHHRVRSRDESELSDRVGGDVLGEAPV